MLVLAAFAVSAVAFSHLPPSFPTHWGLSGKADQFDNRLQFATKLPLVMLGIWLLLEFVPGHDRLLFIKYDVRDDDSSIMRPEYDRIIAIVLAVALAVHTILISSAVGLIGGPGESMMIAVAASFGMIAIGNYLPRVTRRNGFIGFRYPWVYASEEVWRRTQRAAGYGMVVAGIVGAVGAVALRSSPLKPLFAAIMVEGIAVVVYSYYLAHSRNVP